MPAARIARRPFCARLRRARRSFRASERSGPGVCAPGLGCRLAPALRSVCAGTSRRRAPAPRGVCACPGIALALSSPGCPPAGTPPHRRASPPATHVRCACAAGRPAGWPLGVGEGAGFAGQQCPRLVLSESLPAPGVDGPDPWAHIRAASYSSAAGESNDAPRCSGLRTAPSCSGSRTAPSCSGFRFAGCARVFRFVDCALVLRFAVFTLRRAFWRDVQDVRLRGSRNG